MKMRWMLVLSLMVGCGSSSEDRCASVVCDRPPNNHCSEGDTLVEYQASGSCDPDTGECTYFHNDTPCPHGCRDGACLSEDKCHQVICDDPPDNTCDDSQTLRTYDQTGSCNPDDGTCDYDSHQLHCENGCTAGSCQDQDLCQDVVCDRPPDSVCRDETTLVTYQGPGTCLPDSGSCDYPSQESQCPVACQHGGCVGGPQGWGWVRVVEWNDTHSNAPFRNDQGVQGFFSGEARCRWAMEHQQPDSCRVTETVNQGSCSLAIVEGFSDWDCGPAGVICDWETQECLLEEDTFVCGDLPFVLNVGAIAVTGLSEEVVLEQLTDSQGEYQVYGLPDDLFAVGDLVTISATGNDLPPFSLDARGVAPLEIMETDLELTRNQPALIEWIPADPGTRVRVTLSAGSHFPHEYFGTLYCEAEDVDGQIEVPAEIVTAFLDYAASIGIRRNSHLMRYNSAVDPTIGDGIELLVGSARNLRLILR